MQIVVLSAFIVTLTLVSLPEGQRPMPPLVTAGAMGVYLVTAVVLSAGGSLAAMRAFRDATPTVKASRLRTVLSVLVQGWLVGGLGAVIYLGFGRLVMKDMGLGSWPLVGKLVLLAPFVTALLAMWIIQYPQFLLHRRQVVLQRASLGLAYPQPWTLGQYLDNNIRHHLLFIALPVSLIILGQDLVLMYAAPHLERHVHGLWLEALLLAGVSGLSAGVFLVAPLLLVRVWRTSVMPAGAVRDELEDVSRRLGLRHRGLRVWHSGRMIANAAVMGIVGRLRYVLLSDALLEQMSPSDIRAVFAHEAGHILNHHIFYSVIFAVASVVLVSAAASLVLAVAPMGDLAAQLMAIALLAATWALGFGYISRRFERQCDVTAAWLCGYQGQPDSDRITHEGAAIFARALEGVAMLNGMNPRKFNWRHGSIADRVQYVIWLGSTGGNRGHIDRQVGNIKKVLWLSVVVAAALAIAGVLTN